MLRGMGHSITSLDPPPGTPVRSPALRESADWWASADPVYPFGGGAGFGWRGQTGGVGDRKAGRQLPVFWTEMDLRWYRILARHLDSTNNFAIGFLNHLVGYNVRKGFGWQACKKGSRKGAYAGSVQTGEAKRFIDYIRANRGEHAPRLAFADFVEERGHVEWAAGVRERVRANKEWTREDEQSPRANLLVKAQNILDQWRDANLWPLKSREAFRLWRREGEAFGRFFSGGWDRLPSFRLVAGELVGSPTGDTSSNRSFGVETDPDDSQTVWAYFLREQDGDGRAGKWVDADRIVHVKCNVDSCVKRGVTDFLPMSQELEGIRLLLRAMLDTSNAQARVAWREKFPSAILDQVRGMIPVRPTAETAAYPQAVPNNRPIWGDSLWSANGGVRLTAVARVEGNREFEPGPTFGGVTDYLQVEQACLRGMGHRWGMPEYFSGDASNNNFASSLVSGSPFAVAVEGSQLEWGAGWERPVALKVLDFAREAGLLTPEERRQLDVEVTEPAVVTPEPDKDATRVAGLVSAKLLSPQTAQQQLGLDPQHEEANFQAAEKTAGGSGTDDGGLRGTVGGLQAIAQLQQQVYGGQIPREAGIASLQYLFGFEAAEAEAMFPPKAPENTQDQGGGTGQDDGTGSGSPEPGGDGLELLGLSEGTGLVAKKVTVRRKDGTTYQRTQLVAPDEQPTARPAAKAKPTAAKRVPEQTPGRRAARAKASHKLVDKTIQRYAEEHNEPQFAKAVGGLSFKDNEPVDVVVGNDAGVVAHGIELKTMVDNKAGKITMKRSAMERKAQWEKDKDATFHTVVIDDTAVFNAKGEGKHDPSKRKLYYRRGYGSFRVHTMHPVKSVAELRQLLDTDNAALPAAARRPSAKPAAKGGEA